MSLNFDYNTNIQDDLINVSVGNIAGVAYATEICYDRYTQNLLYMSIVGYKSLMDEIIKVFNNPFEDAFIRFRGPSCYKRKHTRYVVESIKNSDTDIVNVIIYLKDVYNVQQTGEDWTLYMYLKEDEIHDSKRIKELLLDKLLKYSSVPILPEWIDYIYEQVEEDMVLSSNTVLEGTEKVYVARLAGNQNSIKTIIERGLGDGSININGSNEPSVLLEDIGGLNDYLSLFGSMLANKIQQKFKPKFIPGTDTYSNHLSTLDDFIHHQGIELYAAQMAVIQANANNFNVNKHGFIVGEMGSGYLSVF